MKGGGAGRALPDALRLRGRFRRTGRREGCAVTQLADHELHITEHLQLMPEVQDWTWDP